MDGGVPGRTPGDVGGVGMMNGRAGHWQMDEQQRSLRCGVPSGRRRGRGDTATEQQRGRARRRVICVHGPGAPHQGPVAISEWGLGVLGRAARTAFGRAWRASVQPRPNPRKRRGQQEGLSSMFSGTWGRRTQGWHRQRRRPCPGHGLPAWTAASGRSVQVQDPVPLLSVSQTCIPARQAPVGGLLVPRRA